MDLDGFDELLDASRSPHAGRDDAAESVADDLDDADLEEGDRDEESALEPASTPRARDRFADLGARSDPGARLSSDAFAAPAPGLGSGTPSEPADPWNLADDGDDTPRKGRDELIVAALGIILAGVTAALPWYRLPTGAEVTGISAGSISVVPFVAGLGAFLIVLLRRVGIALRFPLETGLVIEGLGYVSVGAAIIGQYLLKPGDASVVRRNTIIAVIVSMVLAWMASRLSSGAPMVMRPGWMREKGGRAGALMLVALVLIGGTLAVVKPGGSKPQASGNSTLRYVSDPPACLTDNDFPLPPAIIVGDEGYFEYAIGSPTSNVCGFGFESDLTLKKTQQKLRNQLRANGWKVTVLGKVASGTSTLQLTAPACGSISIFDQSGTEGVDHPTRGSVQVAPCDGLFGQQPGN